ncbi:hypothetical protein HYZ41_04835 [archaeon]|nr:hypothetical protein [archaeon]
MIDVEFILSVVLFFSTITFVSFMIILNVPIFHNEAVNEDIRARAYEISQMLLFDEGYPKNWDITNIKTIGLSTGDNYVLSDGKIASLDALCSSNYTFVKGMLGQGFRNEIRISITDSNGADLLSCMPKSRGSGRSEFMISRFATLPDKRIVRVDVGVL